MDLSAETARIIAALLETHTGQDLPASRQWRVDTALAGLLREKGISSSDQLTALLLQSQDTALSRKVVEALLNNETYFFRDRPMFETLRTRILPELARQRQRQRRLSIWSVGCSTGQEALSLAMMLSDKPHEWAGWTFDILATDVSATVIEDASRSCYSQFQVQRGLAIDEMLRWFSNTADGWQADESLRRMIRYRVHNLLEPLPQPETFDLVLCRNVLLYFNHKTRSAAFERLAAALAPDGWLMLGVGETAVGQTTLLGPDRELHGLFRHVGQLGADTEAFAKAGTLARIKRKA